MTEFSYNGWPAGPGWSIANGKLQALNVAGETFAPGVVAGDGRVVFQYVAEQMHQRVEPIIKAGWNTADDWGYSYRPNKNNPRQLSCHAGGTAFDYNATRHPNGVRGTWTAAQKAEMAEIIAEVDHVVVWGENFTGTIDGMHVELFGNAAAVKRVADRIRSGQIGKSPASSITDRTLTRGMMNDPLVAKVQDFFRDKFPLYAGDLPRPSTGNYLDMTVRVVKEFQRRADVTGSDADGTIIGPRTWAAMRRNGWK